MQTPILITAVILLLATSAIAQPQQQQQSEPHRGPPPEALKACESKKAGDACSFTSPRGKEDGSCFTPESSKPLACRPKNAPPKQ